jgi:hypothetical protein
MNDVRVIVAEKQCSGCLLTKLRAEFSPHVNTRDRLQPKCKACRNAIAQDLGHKPGPGHYSKYDCTEERRAAKRRAYRADPSRAIQRSLKWAKANPARMAARTMRRVAQQRKATPAWADLDRIEALYAEASRREAATGQKWHVDHVVPLISKFVCGLHVEQNLQLLTAAENIAKSNRHWPDQP